MRRKVNSENLPASSCPGNKHRSHPRAKGLPAAQGRPGRAPHTQGRLPRQRRDGGHTEETNYCPVSRREPPPAALPSGLQPLRTPSPPAALSQPSPSTGDAARQPHPGALRSESSAAGDRQAAVHPYPHPPVHTDPPQPPPSLTPARAPFVRTEAAPPRN